MAGEGSAVLEIALLETQEGERAKTEDTRRRDGGEEQETSENDFIHISTARVCWVPKPSSPIWADNGPRPARPSPFGGQCAPPPFLVRFPSQLGYDWPALTQKTHRNPRNPRRHQSRPSRASDYPRPASATLTAMGISPHPVVQLDAF